MSRSALLATLVFLTIARDAHATDCGSAKTFYDLEPLTRIVDGVTYSAAGRPHATLTAGEYGYLHYSEPTSFYGGSLSKITPLPADQCPAALPRTDDPCAVPTQSICAYPSSGSGCVAVCQWKHTWLRLVCP